MSDIIDLIDNSRYRKQYHRLLNQLRQDYTSALKGMNSTHPGVDNLTTGVYENRVFIGVMAGEERLAICLEPDYKPIYRFVNVDSTWSENVGYLITKLAIFDAMTMTDKINLTRVITNSVRDLDKIMNSVGIDKRHIEIDEQLVLVTKFIS